MTIRSIAGQFVRLTSTWVGTVIAQMLRLLPLRISSVVKENFVLTCALDYPGLSILVDSTVEFQVRRNSARKEPETLAWIREHLSPGDVVFDVGANIGAYSLIMDRAFSGQISVFAFEPNFANFYQLCRNIHLNGAHSIHPFPVAFSNRTEPAVFAFSDLRTGSARHTFAGIRHGKVDTPPDFQIKVMAYQMDAFIKGFGLPFPDHLKIDVDGPELLVLDGARESLGTVRSIAIEFESEKCAKDITSYLSSRGFKLLGVGDRFRRGGIGNAIFLRSEESRR